jgi:hypothetical protein
MKFARALMFIVLPFSLAVWTLVFLVVRRCL